MARDFDGSGDIPVKATPVGADRAILIDSADTNKPKEAALSSLGSSHTHDAAAITSGTFDNARVAQSNVTQHQAALSITESQISDLTHTDANAIHGNVAGEISVVTEKLSPVSGDFLLIEDSAATNAKKRVQIGNLPTGSLSDGDKGDITVSGGGATWTIDADAVTYDKMQDATQECIIGAGALGTLGELTLGSGVAITAGVFDVVTDAAAAAVTANTKSAFLDDDYFFGLDPDNASDALKEFGLTFANFKTQLNGIYVTLTEVNTQTGTAYTLALTDASDVVEVNNAGANTVTIPTNAAVAFPVGTIIGVTQLGAGATTVTGDTGVTVNGVSAGGAAIDAQYKGVSIYKRATDTWVMQGAHGTVA